MWGRALLVGGLLSSLLSACAVVDPVDNRYDEISRSWAKARNQAIFLHKLACQTNLLTSLPRWNIGATSRSFEGRLSRRYSGKRSECGARARSHTLRSRGLRASSSPVLRPEREVLSLDWDRQVAGNARRSRVPGSEAWS